MGVEIIRRACPYAANLHVKPADFRSVISTTSAYRRCINSHCNLTEKGMFRRSKKYRIPKGVFAEAVLGKQAGHIDAF